MTYLLETASGMRNVEVLDWIKERRNATTETRDQMDRDAESGQLLTADRLPLSPETEKQVRRRLRDRFGILEPNGNHHFAPNFDQYARETEPSTWLIPGLWPSDTIPLLSGNHKAGKTTLVADLVASLVMPDRLFLDRFGPADQVERNVHLINAETPSASMLDALVEAGVSEDANLAVDDLETRGGPQLFDLTVPELYDRWAELLVYCELCDGSEIDAAGVPDVIVVDGLTAILGGETDRYAKWYAAFRQLMNEIGVRNALVTSHSTMDGKHSMGGVEMLGGPDGLWTYWTSDPDNPTSQRYFKVQPRLGGAVVPKTEVRLEGGRLTASESAEHASGGTEASDARTEVLGRLGKAQHEGMSATELTGSGRVGKERRATLQRLKMEGAVTSRAEGRSTRWFLTDYAD